jgi:DNA-binding SARP family transcriptional activator/Flp pilus assembly protein TadD
MFKISPPSCRIWLLGGLRIEGVSGPLRLPRGLAHNLLAYLALHSATLHPREALADLFWPDAPPHRVRRNLSDLLYRLRRALGPDWLLIEEDRVGLRTGTDLWVDVRAFEDLSTAGDPNALESAIALYTGDLLPEIYDDWALIPRISLQEKYLHCLLRLGQLAEEHDEPAQACTYYQQLVAADALHEEAQRGLMRSLACLGRHHEALRVFDHLLTLLRQELNVSPSAETQALAEILRGELDQRRLVPVPFVGRSAERAHLLDRLQQAQAGRGGLVVLMGEAGIGKTRLLKELAHAAAWRGWQVVWGFGQEFGLPAPYAPLGQALDAALPDPRLQQLTRLIPPLWLTTLSGLLPRISAVVNQFDLATDADRFPLALRHILGALAQIAPHLFILEDVQWADPALWPLLTDVYPALAHIPLLVALSGRDDELHTQPTAWSALEEWDRSGETIMRLDGLSAEELEELAVAFGRRQLTAIQRAELSAASGGNPLLALALLEADETGRAVESSLLADLMARRLADLSTQARQALQAAAVLGYRFQYPAWEAVMSQDTSAEALARVAGELERARLIALEADSYRFAHDTLRAHMYRQLSDRRKRDLHGRALAALSRYTPQATLDLLYHAGQADDRPAVARYALQAGQQALTAWTLSAAVRYFAQALEALSPDDLVNRYAALLGRERALNILADPDARQRDLSSLQELADQLGDVRRQAEAAQRRADASWMAGKQQEAQSLAERGLELARQARDVALEAALLETLGRIARNQGDYQRTRRWIGQAHERFCQAGDRFGQASTLDKLGNLDFEAGDYLKAAEQHTRAAEIFRELGAIVHEARALSGLGLALRRLGQFDRARETHERALATFTETGDRHGAWIQMANLGNIAFELGDYTQAVEWNVAALEICRAIGDPRGASMMLNNLGFAHRGLAQFDQALAHFDEALQINRDKDYRRGEGYTHKGRGLTLLDAQRYELARQAFEAAQAIWVELDDRINRVETVAGLALAHLAENDLDGAQVYLQEALGILDTQPLDPFLRQWVHFVAYRVRQAQGRPADAARHLRQAHSAMQEMVESLPSAARAGFLIRVPLNRQVQAALDTLTIKIQAHLARADAPLGRRLTDADYVTITWTTYAPEDERVPTKTERRQHVLRRLLAEAKAQGGVPTDDDLAAALSVSRRTVLRDMQALGQSGVAIPTRRRR